MLVHSCRDRQNVRIKDDVTCTEASFFCQDSKESKTADREGGEIRERKEIKREKRGIKRETEIESWRGKAIESEREKDKKKERERERCKERENRSREREKSREIEKMRERKKEMYF